MKTKLLLVLLLAQITLSHKSNGAHLRDNILIAARIDGSQQVPSVATMAQGVAGLMLNSTRDTLCVTVSFTGLSGALMGAHIHEGLPGINGPVLIDLTSGINGSLVTATVTGSNLPMSVLTKLLSGECYINLHTSAFPNGEIRGQLMIEADKSFQVMMDGSQEVPMAVTNAFGVGYFDLSKDLSKIKYLVVMQDLSGPLSGAHLHVGQTGASGGVVVDITGSISGNVIAGVISNPSASLIDSMNSGSIYLNVHNSMFPNGEIRGQLLNSSRYLYFDAAINGAQQVPAVATTATAVSVIKINASLDSLWIDAAVDGISGSIMSAHFHSGNPGINGPVELDLTPYINGNRISGTITGSMLTPELFGEMLEGAIYINLHTAGFPNGEIRGQVYRLIREGYTVYLNGDQEIPAVSTIAKGAGIVSIDRDQDNAHFMIVASNITASGAHFHNGVAGQSGPVIYDLTPYYTNGAMYGYWKSSDATPFTVAQSVRFRNDSVYVNLHTGVYPGGEIRGQVLRGFNCVDITTGISTILSSDFKKLNVYPNPATDNISIMLGSSFEGILYVTISNSLGQQLIATKVTTDGKDNDATIDVTGLASGIYSAVIIDPAGNTRAVSFHKL
jgi:hypothetical protein